MQALIFVNCKLVQPSSSHSETIFKKYCLHYASKYFPGRKKQLNSNNKTSIYSKMSSLNSKCWCLSLQPSLPDLLLIHGLM